MDARTAIIIRPVYNGYIVTPFDSGQWAGTVPETFVFRSEVELLAGLPAIFAKFGIVPEDKIESVHES